MAGRKKMRGPVTRAPGPDENGHPAASVTHVHEHIDSQRGGVHTHPHSHSGDANHASHHKPRVGHPGDDGGLPSVPGLAGRAPGGETRDAADAAVSGIGLAEQISRFLASQGVDVQRALRDAQYEREHAGQRARERAASAQELACSLRRAKRALAFEESGWLGHRPGFSLQKRNEAAERVTDLGARLREACVSDPELISEAKRLAAR